MGRLLGARVGAGEGGDEGGILAGRVELGVQGALREDGHLVLLEPVGNDAGVVLGHHLRVDGAVDDEVELGAARVRVWRVEAAGAEEAHRDGGVLADEGWEGHLAAADDGAGWGSMESAG